MAAACAAVALALAAGRPATGLAQGTARARRPTFPVAAEIVRLNVSVTDLQSRYVTGLDESDFAVFENGVRQGLAFFEREPLPMSVALLMDCSGSMQESLPTAQAAALRFLRTLRAQDLAEVVEFNDRVRILQDYTADPRQLETAIRDTRASGGTALYDAVYIVLKEMVAARTEEPRRRAIVLLSDGEDTTSLSTDEQVMELARAAEVTIYPIGLRPDRAPRRREPELALANHFLTTIAHETGGQVQFPKALSELDSMYGRVAEELRTQYTLGYVPANARRDGKWRRVVVRLLGRSDLRTRHRTGYYAPRG
jgi:Ca-activated chloride channel family protein